ncbi:unnamed protein product [Rotaria magnacalcarata]|uniref:Uncharacterized protein n=1 Tax=Rotaria magnacalcarata TaxID=392030 RepID=A0A816VPW3_9BILA|nr:unnamed protein product [Rotaria magnacalcarata]CAF1660204.1 unnamed protein product [Rotaria magnacalcarata]CAF2123367.1 unnamed protein product [Rotaria magnacalcarata]CAF2125045.1 unnamed protein product [Rotaria magnacalcarata]CAF2125408.1 unnamed protein product [Rotaria magnacalcarata]
MTLIVTVFAFIGFVLGVIALTTNYWTKVPLASRPDISIPTENGTYINYKSGFGWKGLLMSCASFEKESCTWELMATTFLLCSLGLISLLVGGIFSIWEMFKTSDRRFLIPMLYFVACVLMTAGLFDYGSNSPLNSHSSRAMISAIVFVYASLPISAFIAGRYSAYERYINNGQKYVPAATNGN